MNDKRLEKLVKQVLNIPPEIAIVGESTAKEVFNLQKNTCGTYISIMATDMNEYSRKQRKVIESYLGEKL